jgi:hypothetical protein
MKISEIETKQDFDDKLNEYYMSDAPQFIKDDAIVRLKRQFPEFVDDAKVVPTEVLKLIEDGAADTDDIQGF